MEKPMNVAIFGASGHIGKGLIGQFLKEREKCMLYAFSRSERNLANFIEGKAYQGLCVLEYEKFNQHEYDIIINCVGAGTPQKISELGGDLLSITERFDDMAIEYLKENPSALYINMSSGAVYGRTISDPITSECRLELNINNMGLADCYLLSKLNSEVKHRAYADLNIVDLRVFGYISEYIDLGSKFLLTEMIECVRNSSVFRTDEFNIVRDYIDQEGLFRIVKLLIETRKINDYFDVYTKMPSSKLEILEQFENRYGLEYMVEKLDLNHSPTGRKEKYYSIHKKLGKLGYQPIRSSLESIIKETDKILKYETRE